MTKHISEIENIVEFLGTERSVKFYYNGNFVNEWCKENNIDLEKMTEEDIHLMKMKFSTNGPFDYATELYHQYFSSLKFGIS